MRKQFVGALLAFALGGCGGHYQWRIQNAPPAWAQTDWTRELGTPFNVRTEGDAVFVGAEGGVYAMKPGGEKIWATAPQAPAKRYLTVGEGKVVVTSYALGDKRHGFWDRTGSDVNTRENGHVTAYNQADGTQLWDVPFDADGSKLSPPAIGQGKVVVISATQVVAIDAASGQVAWSSKLVTDKGLVGKLNKAVPYSRVAPVIVDNMVCASAYYATALYDLASGQRVSDDNLHGYANASLVAQPGVCYVSHDPSSVRNILSGQIGVWAVNTHAGKKHFKKLWSNEGFKDAHDLGVANMVLGPGALYVVTNFRVRAIDPASGKKMWEVINEPVFPYSKALRIRTHQVARDPFGNSYNFTLDTNDGAVWNDAPGTGLAVSADGKLFVPAGFIDPNVKKAPKHDVVTALDAKSGTYLGSFDAGMGAILDLAVAADGTLVVATTEGLKTVKTQSFTPAVAAK